MTYKEFDIYKKSCVSNCGYNCEETWEECSRDKCPKLKSLNKNNVGVDARVV
jgi:hypothetical protein